MVVLSTQCLGLAVVAAAADACRWHAIPIDEVAAGLGTDLTRGLSADEAARRLAAYGANVLQEPPAVPLWRKLLRQFQELVIWILLAAACIAGAMGDWADTAAITAIVLVNGIISFLQEERAFKALAALQRMSAPTAKVTRDGGVHAIPARQLVPGDLIALEAGDQVPADARLVEGYALRVQESALTGESTSVEKDPAAVMVVETPLADRRSMVHAGTVVAAGRGVAIVVVTGMSTHLGRIASMLERSSPETTPLQRRLSELGRILIAVCLGVVGLIFLLELWRGGGPGPLWQSGGFGEVLLRAVSLAVAAVPEGLPAIVTVVLAIGVQRMAAANTLVRRLPSVETLGSVTVVCSDKTGTLTRNEMTVREIVTASDGYHVTGGGYAPHGTFVRRVGGSGDANDGVGEEQVVAKNDPELRQLLSIAVRCNNATVQPVGNGGGWEVVGDPTEGALVVVAMKAGIAATDNAEPTVSEIPFDSDRKRMSVLVRRHDGSGLLYTKGAPEAVLPHCVAEQRGAAVVPLTEARRQEILFVAGALAVRALRVLSLAYRGMPAEESVDGNPTSVERELVHVGLVGMIDPPRDEVQAAVETCRMAGVRPVMITGARRQGGRHRHCDGHHRHRRDKGSLRHGAHRRQLRVDRQCHRRRAGHLRHDPEVHALPALVQCRGGDADVCGSDCRLACAAGSDPDPLVESRHRRTAGIGFGAGGRGARHHATAAAAAARAGDPLGPGPGDPCPWGAGGRGGDRRFLVVMAGRRRPSAPRADADVLRGGIRTALLRDRLP